MTIAEMHVWFRQYAQQMGMQNVRAILPEQIDNLINTSIKDTIDEIINRNIGTTNDRVITDNAKLANINALRTLYNVKVYQANDTNKVSHYKNLPFEITSADLSINALYYVDFSVRYNITEPDPNDPNENITTTTRWFPIRIIDDSYLSDVLNDWVLAPRMRTPVMVVYKSTEVGATVDECKFEIYVGENELSGVNVIATKANIADIRCSYIKEPNKVAYLSDIGGTNVDCDLPEQLQIPMLKHAIDLYRVSINGSLYANQQNQQSQQQEIARNNARPENEGYQS